MSEKNSKITHKELLTFSNLTNLEWEFVKLKQTDENGDVITGEDAEYKKLDDLLDPEVFARRNAEGEVEEYVYMEGVKKEEEITQEKIKEGLADLRKNTGIAMEYLEKSEDGNTEGDFLSEWEVIYGADRYKMMEDYIDQRWEPIRRVLEKSLETGDVENEETAKN